MWSCTLVHEWVFRLEISAPVDICVQINTLNVTFKTSCYNWLWIPLAECPPICAWDKCTSIIVNTCQIRKQLGMCKGLGVENSETLGYPTHVPINVQIWTSRVCSDLEISHSFNLLKIVYSSKSHWTVSIIMKNAISKPGDSGDILRVLQAAVVWHCHLWYLAFPTHTTLSYSPSSSLHFPLLVSVFFSLCLWNHICSWILWFSLRQCSPTTKRYQGSDL